MKIMPWLVALGAGTFMAYLVASGSLYTSEGKFLGVDEKEGIGLDDVLHAAVIIGGAWAAGKAVHALSGGAVPQGVKV